LNLNLNKLREIVWFIYCSISQKQSSILQIVEKLKKNNSLWYTSLVLANSAEVAGIQFLAPYLACTKAEFISYKLGSDCVVVYDDLSKHAIAYRQISLLLRRSPGREAFPGDVFYLHSRLLERAGALRNKKVGKKLLIRGTLTAFPIIETQAGDVSAYIPTNLVSITDGQIFLESELFYRGIRPAISVGLSVSRVGSVAQPLIVKKVSGSLKIELAQFREVEGFSNLGANLDDFTKKILIKGELLTEILKQKLHDTYTILVEILFLFVGLGYNGSWLNEIDKVKIGSKSLFYVKRARISWLENFILKTSFRVKDVNSFLNSVRSFLSTISFNKLYQYTFTEELINNLISKCPFIFFEDILLSYLVEQFKMMYVSGINFVNFQITGSTNDCE
jgi:F-type H+-transporting ATPase subunit alpha